jgi:hypothetical protein
MQDLTIFSGGCIVVSLHQIWKHEGVYGFFKGCVPNVLKTAPAAAITFVVYEQVGSHEESSCKGVLFVVDISVCKSGAFPSSARHS